MGRGKDIGYIPTRFLLFAGGFCVKFIEDFYGAVLKWGGGGFTAILVARFELFRPNANRARISVPGANGDMEVGRSLALYIAMCLG